MGRAPLKSARRLLVSKRSVERVRKHWEEYGALPASRRRGKTATLLAGCEEALEGWIARRPEVALEELAEKLLEEKELKASVSSIWRKLQSLGLRHKKNGFRAAEQDRPDVAERRERWKLEQADWDVSRLVFIDETGLNTKMASLNTAGPGVPVAACRKSLTGTGRARPSWEPCAKGE